MLLPQGGLGRKPKVWLDRDASIEPGPCGRAFFVGTPARRHGFLVSCSRIRLPCESRYGFAFSRVRQNIASHRACPGCCRGSFLGTVSLSVRGLPAHSIGGLPGCKRSKLTARIGNLLQQMKSKLIHGARRGWHSRHIGHGGPSGKVASRRLRNQGGSSRRLEEVERKRRPSPASWPGFRVLGLVPTPLA